MNHNSIALQFDVLNNSSLRDILNLFNINPSVALMAFGDGPQSSAAAPLTIKAHPKSNDLFLVTGLSYPGSINEASKAAIISGIEFVSEHAKVIRGRLKLTVNGEVTHHFFGRFAAQDEIYFHRDIVRDAIQGLKQKLDLYGESTADVIESILLELKAK